MWRIDGFTRAAGVAPKSYFGSLHVEKREGRRELVGDVYHSLPNYYLLGL